MTEMKELRGGEARTCIQPLWAVILGSHLSRREAFLVSCQKYTKDKEYRLWGKYAPVVRWFAFRHSLTSPENEPKGNFWWIIFCIQPSIPWAMASNTSSTTRPSGGSAPFRKRSVGGMNCLPGSGTVEPQKAGVFAPSSTEYCFPIGMIQQSCNSEVGWTNNLQLGKRYSISIVVCMCMYTYIYIHIHIYIHIYIHTYIHTYITLHYITLHYITLHYIALHYIILHYITLHYITLHTYIHTYICINMYIIYIYIYL